MKGGSILEVLSSASLTQKHRTAKGFCLTSAFWFLAATLIGLIMATELVAPDLLGNISWLVFGHNLPIDVNLVLFGFVTSGLLGTGILVSLPAVLLRTEIYSERLGLATMGLWNIILVSAVVTLADWVTPKRVSMQN